MNSTKKSIWAEYYNDPNVKFPKYPCLLDNISIYDAPNGLGIQFRGGPEKLVLKGTKISEYFLFLKNNLKGQSTVEEVFENAYNQGHSSYEITVLLKTLHSYHLIISKEDSESYDIKPATVHKKQIEYYNRMIGLTGANQTGEQTHKRVTASKVLFITSSNLMFLLHQNSVLFGYEHIGFQYILSDQEDLDITNWLGEENDFSHFNNITLLSTDTLREELAKIIDGYTHVCIALDQASLSFLQEITQLCTMKNKPLLYFNGVNGTYEIGPYYVPNDGACYNCYTLRKQSYQDNSYIDYSYQKSAKIDKIDANIKGFDRGNANLALNYLFVELTKIISKSSKPITGQQVIIFKESTTTTDYVPVIKVSGCPTCSKN